MIEYRPFQNTDAPAVVDIWRQQPNCRVTASSMTRSDMDRMVFGKPYFDANGFIVAQREGKAIGFAHSGFGPNEARTDVDPSIGMITQVRVVPCQDSASISHELIRRSIEYLQASGSSIIYGGSCFPFAPFYLGIYGGSRVPGVAVEDELMTQAFLASGFEKKQSVKIVQRRLAGFRPSVDRKQRQIRRQFSVAPIVDPKPTNWWDSCMFGWHEIFGFWLIDKKTEQQHGRVIFWDIQPLSSEWGTRTMGLCDLQIDAEFRRQGLATYLVGESFRQLAGQAVSIIELQYLEDDHAIEGLAKKLAFEDVSSGTILALNDG